MHESELSLISEEVLEKCVLRPERARLAQILAAVYMLAKDDAESAAAAVDLQFASSDSQLLWTDSGSTKRLSLGLGHFDPASAWEALASQDLLPIDWLQSADREFVTTPLHRALLDKGMDPKITPHPHTLRGCVSVACSVYAMLTAEMLLRAANDTLKNWGAAPLHGPILWQIDEPLTFEKRYAVAPWLGSAAYEAAQVALSGRTYDNYGRAITPAAEWRKRFSQHADDCAREARKFAERSAREEYRRSQNESEKLQTPERNPFEPVLRIWLTGVLPLSLESKGKLALIEL